MRNDVQIIVTDQLGRDLAVTSASHDTDGGPDYPGGVYYVGVIVPDMAPPVPEANEAPEPLDAGEDTGVLAQPLSEEGPYDQAQISM